MPAAQGVAGETSADRLLYLQAALLSAREHAPSLVPVLIYGGGGAASGGEGGSEEGDSEEGGREGDASEEDSSEDAEAGSASDSSSSDSSAGGGGCSEEEGADSGRDGSGGGENSALGVDLPAWFEAQGGHVVEHRLSFLPDFEAQANQTWRAQLLRAQARLCRSFCLAPPPPHVRRFRCCSRHARQRQTCLLESLRQHSAAAGLPPRRPAAQD